MSQDKELNIKVLFASLAEEGVVKVAIGFDGSGDSGSIENDAIICYVENDDSKLTELENVSTDVMNILADLGYHILDKYYDYDWYNDDGGYGKIHIDIKDQNWDIEGYQRVQSVEAADEEGDLTTALDSFIKD